MIYLDNAATTRPLKSAVSAAERALYDLYFNPSALYAGGIRTYREIDGARGEILSLLADRENFELVFTSCGTESDSTAVFSAVETQPEKRHFITTRVEHPAVIALGNLLEKRGYDVTWLGVDSKGRLDLDELARSIRKDTALVSIMFANNEIGTIQPVKEIAEIAREHGILFHTDAVQAYGHVPINVDAFGMDMLSASGHKINGPKGIRFLYIRTGVKIRSFVHGGAQERKRRAGTENVTGIAGLGKAAELAVNTMEERMKK